MIKIFNANDREFSTNGNIAIKPLKCLETKKKSLNGWYVEVEVNIKYKDYIEQDKLCVVKTKSKINPQAFRIDSLTKTSTRIKFTANHVMFDAKNYFLNDVRPTDKNGQNTLSYINERTDKTSPFVVYSNVQTINTAYFIRKNLLEAWEIIEERWEGIFDADNWNIRFLNKVGNDNGEVIAYKKNMQGIEIFEDWTNVVTRIYPVGYDEVVLPEKFLESEVQYERPYTKTIDFETNLEDEEKTEAKLIKELRENAKKYLEINQFPKVSYEITSNINQNMEIGDMIHVKHPLVTLLTEVLEYRHNILTKKIETLVFGNYTRDVKQKFNNIKESVKTIEKKISAQEIAILEQTNLINTLNKQGYVYIDDNEILILDKLPREQAKNIWRFGLGGIGFSSNGYEGPFETAMTMDGRINANFITTGTLDASRITTGILKSANYKSGVSGTSINLTSGAIDTAKFKVDANGEMAATAGEIGGFGLSENEFSANIKLAHTYTTQDLERLRKILIEEINATSNDYEKYDLSQKGAFNSRDLMIIQGLIVGKYSYKGYLKFDTLNAKRAIQILDGNSKINVSIGEYGSYFNFLSTLNLVTDSCDITDSVNINNNKIFIGSSENNGNSTSAIIMNDENNNSTISLWGHNGNITCTSLTQTSLKSKKKNIRRLDINALELIKKSDICSYNFKDEKNINKQHIGLVIDEKKEFNCPEVVISKNGEGIEQYSMISLAWKAIQELVDENIKLKKKVERLENIQNFAKKEET